MCLSTVYKNTLTPETVMMKNVMRIECKDGMVILTDLMERQMAIEGTLEMANLVDGVAVVKEAAVKLGYAGEMREYKDNPDNYKGSIADFSTVVRVALTSKCNTPDLYEIMRLLGKDRIMSRINKVTM